MHYELDTGFAGPTMANVVAEKKRFFFPLDCIKSLWEWDATPPPTNPKKKHKGAIWILWLHRRLK